MDKVKVSINHHLARQFQLITCVFENNLFGRGNVINTLSLTLNLNKRKNNLFAQKYHKEYILKWIHLSNQYEEAISEFYSRYKWIARVLLFLQRPKVAIRFAKHNCLVKQQSLATMALISCSFILSHLPAPPHSVVSFPSESADRTEPCGLIEQLTGGRSDNVSARSALTTTPEWSNGQRAPTPSDYFTADCLRSIGDYLRADFASRTQFRAQRSVNWNWWGLQQDCLICKLTPTMDCWYLKLISSWETFFFHTDEI